MWIRLIIGYNIIIDQQWLELVSTFASGVGSILHPSHASVTCYGLPNQCGCMSQQVVGIGGFGEPSKAGIMDDQVERIHHVIEVVT